MSKCIAGFSSSPLLLVAVCSTHKQYCLDSCSSIWVPNIAVCTYTSYKYKVVYQYTRETSSGSTSVRPAKLAPHQFQALPVYST